jgi:hypothetical protein
LLYTNLYTWASRVSETETLQYYSFLFRNDNFFTLPKYLKSV